MHPAIKPEATLYNEEEAHSDFPKNQGLTHNQYPQFQQPQYQQSQYRHAPSSQPYNPFPNNNSQHPSVIPRKPLFPPKQEQQTNPREIVGKQLKCRIFDSILHLLRDCQDGNSKETKGKHFIYRN